jgi:hypothetical protein
VLVGVVDVLAAGADDEVANGPRVADRVGILDGVALVVMVVSSERDIDAILVEEAIEITESGLVLTVVTPSRPVRKRPEACSGSA